jgi:dolichyl-phosphate-mannose-protein mannosyltransferase
MEIYSRIKEWSRRVYKWEYLWLCLILAATLVIHFSIINSPKELMFDENHYVGDARNIIQNNEDLRPEHPPLAKLFIVAGIKIFGDNPLGWRFFSVLFGTAIIVLFYFLCRKLGMTRRATNLATFLLAMENLTFMQASVAMLDVYFVTFMLLAFLLYLYRKYIASGIAVGLSGLSKLYGAFAVPVMIIHWFFTKDRERRFAVTIILALVSFVVLLPLFNFAISRHFQNPFGSIYKMISLTGGQTFANSTHPFLSRPWDWVFMYKPFFYWYTPHYIGATSFTIWLFIIPSFAYMIYCAAKRIEAGLFGAAWFFSTYVLLIPISLITNRISFLYYFYPSIGAICLGIGMGLSQFLDISKTWKSKKLRLTALSGVGLYLFLHLVFFMIVSPLTNWLTIKV